MAFSQDIARITRLLEARLTEVARSVALDGAQRMSRRSPVLTGRFINNWQGGRSSPNRSTTVGTDKSGGAALDRIHVEARQWRLGETFYVTNSLPYGPELEDGRSQKAPQGMVRITAAEVPYLVDEHVRRVARG